MPKKIRLSDLPASLRSQLPKVPKRKREPSPLEELFAQQVTAHGLPPAVREYRFCDSRKWRADFAWPELRLLVEIEGGTWSGGRHTRGAGYLADCDKYNQATLDGWHVLRFPADRVRDGNGIAMVQKMLDLLRSRT